MDETPSEFQLVGSLGVVALVPKDAHLPAPENVRGEAGFFRMAHAHS
jgi:hypothetical protein